MRSASAVLPSEISIHAPRGGSDRKRYISERITEISIHAPRGGSDGDDSNKWRWPMKFQSTLPVGGATTLDTLTIKVYARFQSTLPVGGATASECAAAPSAAISIHAPRGGSDLMTIITMTTIIIFQSTLPVGGATNFFHGLDDLIHDFNPRSPWGERRNLYWTTWLPSSYFNPRSPWGERQRTHYNTPACCHFNPRSPWGERPTALTQSSVTSLFQSTLPVGGATAYH